MSALGHEQTSRDVRVMSVIPLKADIHQRGLHVRLANSGHRPSLPNHRMQGSSRESKVVARIDELEADWRRPTVCLLSFGSASGERL